MRSGRPPAPEALSVAPDARFPRAEVGFFFALLPTAAGIIVVNTTAAVLSGVMEAVADGVTALDAAVAAAPGVVSGVVEAPVDIATTLASVVEADLPLTAVAFAVAFAVVDAAFERAAAVFDAAVDFPFLFFTPILCPAFAQAGWNKSKPNLKEGGRKKKLRIKGTVTAPPIDEYQDHRKLPVSCASTPLLAFKWQVNKRAIGGEVDQSADRLVVGHTVYCSRA